MFFIISGILITHSYIRSKNNFVYLYRRFIRLFPGLFVCAIFTIIIIGSINTTLPLIDFFANKQVYNYFLQNSFLLTASALPGVFEANPYPNAVNGSLWTLRFEVILYLIVFIIGGITKYKKRGIVLMMYIVLFICSLLDNSQYFRTFTYFFLGMSMYLYREKIKLNKGLFWGLLFSGIALMSFGKGFDLFFKIFGGYLVFYSAFSNNKLAFIDNIGDFSYAIYIYSFPIQQTIYNFFDVNPFINFIITLLIVSILAIRSWYKIEKPLMKYDINKIINSLKNNTKSQAVDYS